MKNLDCNQIKIFIHLKIIGEEDKNQKKKKLYTYIFLILKKKFCNLVKLLGTTMVFKPNFYFILALCSCDARLNQNSYVNSFLFYFILIYLKLNNRVDNKNK